MTPTYALVAAGAGIVRHPEAYRTSLHGRNVTRRHRIQGPLPPTQKRPDPKAEALREFCRGTRPDECAVGGAALRVRPARCSLQEESDGNAPRKRNGTGASSYCPQASVKEKLGLEPAVVSTKDPSPHR